MNYLDFDLLFRREGDHYKALVLRSPGGEAQNTFSLPTEDKEYRNLFLEDGLPHRGSRGLEVPEAKIAKDFGAELYAAIFHDDIETCLRVSLGEARISRTGLRIRLRMSEAPELADLPWEFLYSPKSSSFLALNTETPIVRYLELPEAIGPLRVEQPLRVLVVSSSPKDKLQLDVADESQRLLDATEKARANGSLIVDTLPGATLKTLRTRLQESPVHILHFIGHGDFDERSQAGVLFFENESGDSKEVTGELLAVLLGNHPSIRLVVLNACHGARTSQRDPFAGVSQSLLRRGLPAAIAMQFAITDKAARVFAESFYGALANGYAVDAALVEARAALYVDELAAEWGTPVLFMRSPDGRIFDVQHRPLPGPTPSKKSARWVFAIMATLVLLTASGVLTWRHFHPVLKVPRLAVVGPVNGSHLERYDYVSTAIGDFISLELSSSNKINPVPRGDIVQAQEDLQIPANQCSLKVHPAPLGSVLGASYLIFGQFKEPDDPHRADEVHVFLCLEDAEGNVLDSWDGYTNDAQVHASAAVAADRFRQHLGPQPPPAQNYEDIYPQKPEALRLYFEGVASLRTFSARSAQETLERASSIEDSSPLIHAALSDAWSMLRHDNEAAKEAQLALKLLRALPVYPLEYSLLLKAESEEKAHQWEPAISDYAELYGANRERLDYGLKLASVQLRGSHVDEALTTLGWLKGLGSPIGKDPRILIAQSRVYQAQPNYKKAAASAEQALKVAGRSNGRIVTANALLELCWTHIKLGQENEIRNACEKAKENFSVAGDEVSAAVALNAEANWLGERGLYKDAKDRFQQVIDINEKYGALRDLAGALLNSANISIQQNRRREAAPLLTRSLGILRNINEKPDQAAVLVNLAEVSKEQGDILASKSQATEALAISRDIKNSSLEALALSALAQDESETGNLPGALDMYGNVLSIRQNLGEQSKIATTMARIADVYFRMGDLANSERNCSDALEIYKRVQKSSDAAQTSLALAEIAFEQGLLPKAEAEVREVIKSFEALQDEVSQKDALALLVRILIARGKESIPEAQTQVDKMKALPKPDPDADIDPDPDVELDAALAEGLFLTATGKPSEGYQVLHSASIDAHSSGRIFAEHELWLAAVEAQAKSGNSKAARNELAKLTNSAHQLGFKIISDHAVALSASLNR
jgi:tetratricopeptide (TPR) repeat protein